MGKSEVDHVQKKSTKVGGKSGIRVESRLNPERTNKDCGKLCKLKVSSNELWNDDFIPAYFFCSTDEFPTVSKGRF